MINEWGGKPLPLSATCCHAGRLAVRLSGAAPAVDRGDAQTRRRADAADGDALLGGVREQTHPFFAAASRGGRRAAVAAVGQVDGAVTRPRRRAADRVGRRAALAGRRRAHRAARSCAPGRRATAATRRCSAAADKSAGAFHPLPAPLAALHRRLKAAFDPARHPQPRPALRRRSDARCRPRSPTSSATRPRAAKPTRSCARACTAASARRPARPTSCWATSSTARAGAST